MAASIDQIFPAFPISGSELDSLLSMGWRHTSEYFFRMNKTNHGEEELDILPLRIRLDNFRLSRSQQRILRKNEDLKCIIRPTQNDEEKVLLFEIHKIRFGDTAPESLGVYLSEQPGSFPCISYEFDVRSGSNLLAVSFLDLGKVSTSAVYAMFDPAEAKRGLGIYTMLKEIEFSIKEGKEFYYPGYAYAQSSFYDYKKNFHGLESYNWNTNEWETFTKGG